MRSSKSFLQYEHFRNAIAQMWVAGGEFHGVGIIISDQAEILIGTSLFIKVSFIMEICMDGLYFLERILMHMVQL